MRGLVQRLLTIFSRDRLDRDLDDDIHAHLELLASEYERRGLTAGEARLAARRAFGGVEQMKERHRDQRGFVLTRGLIRDVRFGVRLMLKERGFTAIAVLALALGIAANHLVFTLVNGFLFRDLPFADPDRIVAIGSAIGGSSRVNAGISYLDLQDWRRAARMFDGLGAAREMTMNVADGQGVPERFIGSYISANAFDLIGQRPILGRGFRADDDRLGAEPVAILGYSVWRTRYQSDPGVIGRTIRVNGTASTVIGVMPEQFGFPMRSRIWQPLAFLSAEILDARDQRVLDGFGRVTAGTSTETAALELRTIAARLTQENPSTNRNVEPRVALYRERGLGGGRLRSIFPLLLTMVGFVLLMACANVANLLLARAAYRAPEISMRLAIGATRGQIVRQLLVESTLLAVVAGTFAAALSSVGVTLFSNAVTSIEEGLPYWIRFPMDWRVFAFLAVVCLGTAMAFGAIPALHLSGSRVAGLMVKDRSSGTIRQRRWTTTLVVVQLALAPILLTGAGLMIRSVMAQDQIDAGVATASLVRMRIDLTGMKYPAPADRARFYRQLDERLSSGDPHASLMSHGPFEGAAIRRLIDGRVPTGPDGATLVDVVTIGRSYFETLAAKAVRGRTFNAFDGSQNLIPAIVNEKFAEVHSPGQDPLGRVIRLATARGEPTGEQALTIVGVSANVRQRSTESNRGFEPIVYLSYASNPLPRANIIVRTTDGAAAAATRVREVLRSLDRDLPVYDVRTYDESLAQSDERMGGFVFGSMLALFAAIALLLAMIGLYAVITYTAAQRTREIGVRVALGAAEQQIAWLVTKRAAFQLAVGLSIGLAGALGVGQLLRGVLVGVTAGDPVTLVGVVLLLVIVTGAASFAPVRRATRLNPVDALRAE